MEKRDLLKNMFNSISERGLIKAGNSSGRFTDKDISVVSNISTESLFNSDRIHELDIGEDTKTFVSGVVNAIKTVNHTMGSLSFESYSDENTQAVPFKLKEGLTAAQQKAGLLTAMMMNGVDSFKGFLGGAKEMLSKVSSEGHGYISTEALTDLAGLSVESYDPTQTSNAVLYNVIVNIQCSKASPFSEAFFPTVIMAPNETGMTIVTELTSFVEDYKRTGTGAPVKVSPKPIVKHAFDGQIFSKDTHKLIPLHNDSTKDNFVENTVHVSSKYNKKTGSLVVSRDIDIIDLGLGGSLNVSEGTPGREDALYPDISVSHLVLSLKTNNKTNLIRANIGGIGNRNFLMYAAGHDKAMSLQQSNVIIPVQIGNDLPTGVENATYSKQDWGTDLDTYKGYTLELKLGYSGEANIQTGVVSFETKNVVIEAVRNTSGALVGATELAAIKELFTEIKGVGFELNASITNTNMRKRGQLIQRDRLQSYFPVAFIGGFTLTGPITNFTGKEEDTDMSLVESHVTANNLKSDYAAVERLLETVNELRSKGSSRVISSNMFPQTNYPGEQLVDAYLEEGVLNIPDILDSISSGSRDEDIRAALISKLRQYALNMYAGRRSTDDIYNVDGKAIGAGIGSYQNLHKTSEDGKSPAYVLIGTDLNIYTYLTAGKSDNLIKFSEELIGVIVYTPNPLMTNRIIMAFSATDTIGSIDKPNLRHFGIRAYSPMVVVPLQRQDGGISVESTSISRYKHIVLNPVMTSLTVTNLVAITDKVPVLMKAVSNTKTVLK